MPRAQTCGDIRQVLRDAVADLDHVLPAQAPIRDFVHHNTLHGFQHLPFHEALAASERLTGARGYLPEDRYREFYDQGRIDRDDLAQVLCADPALGAQEVICSKEARPIRRLDIYVAAMLHPFKPVTACQLTWQVEELHAFQAFQPDVDEQSRNSLLAAARAFDIDGEAAAIEDLWEACLEGLGLTHYILHPEELTDLSPEQAEQMLGEVATDDEESEAGQPLMDLLVRREANHLLKALLDRMGGDLTLRGLMLAVTGRDILDDLRPTLLRQLAGYLDQGLAAWHPQAREEGFYAAWRRSAAADPGWVFEELPDWHAHLESLPDDPLETVITELRRLGLNQARWAGYLQRLALEIPGWSGMFLWRHLHPGYEGLEPERVEMMDYLAVRLVLEHLFAQRLCTQLWQVEASIDLIRWHFRRHNAEFLVRYSLYNTRLPEYLASLAHRLAAQATGHGPGEKEWWQAAHMINTWRESPAADRPEGHSVYGSAWRLFRLSQHLGLTGADIRSLDHHQVEDMLSALDRLTPDRTGYLWLQSYELHYRDQLFNALTANHGRERRPRQETSAQLVFCMDDREEGTRRHLEEIDPSVATFGAAAHFGVPNYWRGLDDAQVTPLCPVVVTPEHEVREGPREGQEALRARREKRRRHRLRLGNLLHQESRRDPLNTALLIPLAASGALVTLAGKLFAPLALGSLLDGLRRRYDLEVATEVAISAGPDDRAPTPEEPRLGFTDAEQVDRVETVLRNIGLIDAFAPLVVIMAHGSSSQNNPHVAAYDCGACSGRHSGPNARILAAMANRPEVRAQLATRGIRIPEGTWFLGAEHNTCTEELEWYDLHTLPEGLRDAMAALRGSLDEACRRHAHERCRRFASAPPSPTPEQALAHVTGRAFDFSQARPELGHATNAAAFIGRRSMSRGAFFDRRVFLISYDATTDPSGEVLERLLLANAPVGAGINLEYYFSTVDNDGYGCGSKVTHNLTGLFGVMDGASSDLRTGLPRQMIEIHEAMRLQVVVEATTETLTEIYTRQPPLQELIGNGWLLVSAMDPDSGALSVFDPRQGFLPWQGKRNPLPRVKESRAWYEGQHGPLSPALLATAKGSAHA